jgi:hypothetical protein
LHLLGLKPNLIFKQGYSPIQETSTLATGSAEKLKLIAEDITIVKFPMTIQFDVSKDINVAKDIFTRCLAQEPLDFKYSIRFDMFAKFRTASLTLNRDLEFTCPFQLSLLREAAGFASKLNLTHFDHLLI